MAIHWNSFSLLVVLLALRVFLGAAPLAGQPPVEIGEPEPVADLETGLFNPGSSPQSLVPLGDRLYFSASDPLRGETLWRSDGTTEGTVPVTDLCPGPCDVSINELTAVGDRLFFVGFEEPFSYRGGGGRNITLWTSDGTGAGTMPLLRGTSLGTGLLSNLTVFGGALYFSFIPEGLDAEAELWTSDGTREGTRPTELCPASCVPLFAAGGALLLRVTHAAGEHELWATGGTPEGTGLLAEVVADAASDVFGRLAVTGGRAFFNGTDDEHGTEPWVTDGTPEGTFRLVDLVPGPGSGAFQQAVALGGEVYLLGAGPADGPRFWRTDGTAAGTVPAEDLLGAGRGLLLLGVAPPVAGRFLYLATYSVPDGGPQILWRFDAMTAEIRELLRGNSSGLADAPLGMPLGEGLVFYHFDVTTRSEPWFTDGTAGGTRLLRDIHPGIGSSGPFEAAPLSGRVVFAAEDDQDHRELWVTDGTPAGTVLLADLAPPHTSSDPRELTPHAGSLYFAARGHPITGDLYRAQASTGGVELIAEGAGGSLTSVRSELFMTDGSGRPMALGPGATTPVTLGEMRWARYFTAGPGGRAYFGTLGSGEELWSSDGTPAGTRLVVDIDPEWLDACAEEYPDCPPPFRDHPSYPSGLATASGALVFTAVPAGEHVPAAWATDGTAAGTVRISPEGAGPVYETAAFRGGVLFVVRGFGGPSSLWWSDGTAAGTRRLHDFGADRTPERLTVAGARAYFLVAGDGQPLALWRTDATLAGTAPVAPLGTAQALIEVDEIAAAGGRVYLSVHDDELGDELWVSDGTAAGTGPIVDLWPGPRGSNPAGLTGVGRYLVFAADDGESGHEPWLTDGTAVGTLPLGDLHPGPAPSSPAGFTALGDRVYFGADDGWIDRELWSFRLAQAGGGEPPPADATEIAALELGDFRLWVRITAHGEVQPVRREPCIPETVCVSGALPGRSELFVRIVGPKPNGRLWPTLVRFSTSTLEVWIEQEETGILRHYRLEGATPGSSDLDGLFDRDGFPP